MLLLLVLLLLVLLLKTFPSEFEELFAGCRKSGFGSLLGISQRLREI